MIELELARGEDGIVRLYFEDRLHGNDRVFILSDDGKAYEQDPGDETELEVSLVEALRAMVAD